MALGTCHGDKTHLPRSAQILQTGIPDFHPLPCPGLVSGTSRSPPGSPAAGIGPCRPGTAGALSKTNKPSFPVPAQSKEHQAAQDCFKMAPPQERGELVQEPCISSQESLRPPRPRAQHVWGCDATSHAFWTHSQGRGTAPKSAGARASDASPGQLVCLHKLG